MAVSVLSGNRNFEGRVNPDVRANYLASPPLVVAYALAGSMLDRPRHRAARRGQGRQAGLPEGHLADHRGDRRRCSARSSTHEMFATRYGDVFKGDKALAGHQGRRRPDLRLGHGLDLCPEPALLRGHDDDARRRSPTSSRRASWASSATRITTDHISPAGSISKTSPAGDYLSRAPGADQSDFNSYGARRGNHEVMMRGTFANIRIRNRITPGHRRRA